MIRALPRGSDSVTLRTAGFQPSDLHERRLRLRREKKANQISDGSIDHVKSACQKHYTHEPRLVKPAARRDKTCDGSADEWTQCSDALRPRTFFSRNLRRRPCGASSWLSQNFRPTVKLQRTLIDSNPYLIAATTLFANSAVFPECQRQTTTRS